MKSKVDKRTDEAKGKHCMENDQDLHVLFADYLQTKIEDGGFPRGCEFPSPLEFTFIFKVAPADVVKSIAKLEERKLVKIESSTVKVVSGRSPEKFKPIDVIDDIGCILSRFEVLEKRALESAWPYLNKSLAKSLLAQPPNTSPCERIRQVNGELHSWAIGNCEDMEVCRRLESAYSQTQFFMQAYLESASQEEMHANAQVCDSILCSIACDDLSGTHSRFSKHVENAKRTLQRIFFTRMESYIKG